MAELAQHGGRDQADQQAEDDDDDQELEQREACLPVGAGRTPFQNPVLIHADLPRELDSPASGSAAGGQNPKPAAPPVFDGHGRHALCQTRRQTRMADGKTIVWALGHAARGAE
jgi:hypothetical protein